MMQSDFLNELRAATGPVHQELEKIQISKIIVSPEVTLEKYEEYLQKVLALHTAVEQTIFPILNNALSEIQTRKKREAILKDLTIISSGEKEFPVSFLDDSFRPTVPFCMGMMYVTEGSTLGGMHISKNILSVLKEQINATTNFLTVYGAQTGHQWKRFVEQLNSYQEGNKEHKQEIMEGAVYGFKRAYEVFNHSLLFVQ